jgi:hypothetical protein
MQDGEGWDPTTGQTIRHDNGFRRGFCKQIFYNSWNLIFFLGSLVTAGLGCYSAIEGLVAAFAVGRQTSFRCTH